MIRLDIDLSIDPKEVSVIIKDFIKTYVKNSGCKSVVIGLSGGVDSAVVALLCKDVLGKKYTKCVFLPDDTTPKLDFKHQELLVKKFDLLCEKKDIAPIVQQISRHCIVKPDRYALANIKARARMILLFEYANITKSLVCGTSNKSEILLGYFTKYGDGAEDIIPLGDLLKSQVKELARSLNIPQRIINKTPSAGLWSGQTDEGELGISYYQLDDILSRLESKQRQIQSAGLVNKVKSRIRASEHKRQLPQICEI